MRPAPHLHNPQGAAAPAPVGSRRRRRPLYQQDQYVAAAPAAPDVVGVPAPPAELEERLPCRHRVQELADAAALCSAGRCRLTTTKVGKGFTVD